MLKPALRFFIVFFFCCGSSLFAQELVSEEWAIGAWTPGENNVWPKVPSSPADSSARTLDIQGFGALQYSPGALLRGAFWNWPSAGGTGWQLGMTWDWAHDRFYSRGHGEHWRVAGVSAHDWNEAWQWGTWDGMGWGLESQPGRHRLGSPCGHRRLRSFCIGTAGSRQPPPSLGQRVAFHVDRPPSSAAAVCPSRCRNAARSLHPHGCPHQTPQRR